MNRKTALATIVGFVATFALIISAVFAGGVSQPAQTATAESVWQFRYVTLATNTGTTATTVTGTGLETAYYGTADCFVTYVSGTAVAGASFVTATYALQTSLDNVNFATSLTFPAVITPSTIFTRTPLYGGYTRAVLTAGNTTAVTSTLKCKLIQSQQ